MQLKNLESVETPDPATVVYHLARPDVLLLLLLDFISSPQGAVVSPQSLKTAANLKAGGPDLAGTGPFVLDRYTVGGLTFEPTAGVPNSAYQVWVRK